MNKKNLEGLSGGILLIGLGIIFLTDIGFWPWILVVVGLAGLPASVAMKRGWYGWQGFFWMAGLALLFWSGRFWPGILILVGLSALFGALTREGLAGPSAARAEQGQAEPSQQEPFGVDESDAESE